MYLFQTLNVLQRLVRDIRIPHCEEKMTGSRSKSATGSRYFYYHCNYCAKERYPKDLVNKTFEDILDDLTFTNEAKEIYKSMVKDLLSDGANDSKLKLEQLSKSLNETNSRIEKLQDLFVDGKIGPQEYSDAMSRYKIQINNLKYEIDNLKKVDGDYLKWLKNGVDALSNLKTHYTNSVIRDKQQLLSSIFPEKIVFDGKKCRTNRINDVLRFILQIDNELGIKKKWTIIE